ncbi:putative DNA-binding domain-containing protein [Oleiagrimonas sp. MCCC 1A03011]|uniref:HvfC/BufC family peptide modification chaperone n=1 Tax=Oleiagrimonas sp. MCCC 1A03011 TaxID=1926883 RepID=UPI000DC4CF15|nr:putative DNA-binding domain-containing protein [Oleiagrimonas sp. MCCC 1A03011]RAP56944.1 hypothetical protein BTJ49_12465 [Oleiagrimonas sp. MCCC 1A03011]
MHAPPSLHELQRAFAASLIEGDAPMLTPWIAARGIDPQARLRIYRNAGYAIHVEALEAVFPAVRALIGEESFDGLATRYTARRGSDGGNLQHFGRDFAVFLGAQPELAGYAWLVDVAQLEWLRQEALLAAEHPVADIEALLRALDEVPAERLHLPLQPHVRVLQAAVPALDLWTWARDPQGDAPDPRGAPQSVLLWRHATQIIMQPVTPDAARFLQALREGRLLAEALGADADPARLPALLQPVFEHALLAASTVHAADTTAPEALS